jgi:hypothetical protein
MEEQIPQTQAVRHTCIQYDVDDERWRGGSERDKKESN